MGSRQSTGVLSLLILNRMIGTVSVGTLLAITQGVFNNGGHMIDLFEYKHCQGDDDDSLLSHHILW